MAQELSVFSNIQDNRTSSLAEQVADQMKMKMGCRMMFTTAPTSWLIMLR